MKCLVVSAHPLAGSLCRSLTDQVVADLGQKGHDVTLTDLYADGFQAALTVAERETYYGGYDTRTVREPVANLLEAEALVLVFPTWWFGFPAILKGWFDRVWGPGIAYDHASDLGPISARLGNLKHVLAITTLGSPWWVDHLVMRRPVKRILKTGLLGVCSSQAKLQFLALYNSEALTPSDVDKFRQKITRALAVWA